MATASQAVALDTFTDSGTHAHRDRPGDRWPYRVADLGPFQLLDVAATRDAERGRLTISVVNRDPDQAIATRIRLHDAKATGVMTVHEVTGDRPEAANTFARPDAVSVHNSKREVDGEHVDITLRPALVHAPRGAVGMRALKRGRQSEHGRQPPRSAQPSPFPGRAAALGASARDRGLRWHLRRRLRAHRLQRRGRTSPRSSTGTC